MKSRATFALAALVLTALAGGLASAETVWLDKLDLSVASQGWGEAHPNKSVEGHPLKIGGQLYERGFGTHANGTLLVNLDGHAQSFSASVGVDDEVNGSAISSVEFSVIGDGKVLWTSGIMRAGDTAKYCEVDVSGVKAFVLKTGDAGDGDDYDHADWVDAKFESDTATTFVTTGEATPELVTPYMLTPAAPPTPRINGADIFGVRPGSPFLYTIAATGERPMKFKVEDLPRGLRVDSKTGQITGVFRKKGEFVVTLRAKNLVGTAEKKFKIVCGDQICLTPPMGWNSWNCFAHGVSEDRVKHAADALVKSGLINHGWTYINVDDFWQNHRDSQDSTLQGKFRDDKGFVVPNSRFPDMKGMAGYIHSLGLKAGLYSSPGPWTCGGCTGSYQHEQQDAQTYAKWGFDYLKYDWCSYQSIAEGKDPTDKSIPSWSPSKGRTDVAVAKDPYATMGKYLRQQPRDIVFSLCQYGMADVWQWGGSVNGNCWRTTGDIVDTWRSMSNIGFRQDKAAPYAKPGNWNDPDMLIVGQVGWGNTHPTRLPPDEQYTHISLWCMLSAPLLIGCDMEKFDDFTLNLLSNDEVLAVDQDALGKQATCVLTNGTVRVFEKPLADGSQAVGYFNLGNKPVDLNFNQFSVLGLAGKLHIRDLWRQQDLLEVNTAEGAVPMTVPAHGVMLYKFAAGK